jgi:hypothetical protein
VEECCRRKAAADSRPRARMARIRADGDARRFLGSDRAFRRFARSVNPELHSCEQWLA